MPCWVEFIALLKLVFGLLLPAGLTLECIVISETRSKEWFSYWFLRSFISYFLSSGPVSVTYVPVASELEVCLLAWLFLPQGNGYRKLCEKWRHSVGTMPVSHTREEEESSTSTLIDYLSEEIKTMLRRKEEEVRLARLSGNVFEARVREKRLKKAMTRVQSLTAKLNKDNTEQEVSRAECKELCKQQSKTANINPSLTSYAFRQALVQQVIPE